MNATVSNGPVTTHNHGSAYSQVRSFEGQHWGTAWNHLYDTIAETEIFDTPDEAHKAICQLVSELSD